MMKHFAPPRDKNRMKINTVFVTRQIVFDILAESHAGQLLKMALAHINIPTTRAGVQADTQGERERGRESTLMSGSFLS